MDSRLKYDGFRILIIHARGTVELLSRRGTAYQDIFPELVAEVACLPDLAIDGELVSSTQKADRSSASLCGGRARVNQDRFNRRLEGSRQRSSRSIYLSWVAGTCGSPAARA